MAYRLLVSRCARGPAPSKTASAARPRWLLLSSVSALTFSCTDLRDACLELQSPDPVVGNDVQGDGKSLVIITGANSGGKSTFLRSVGVAQLMMQCGLFVTAGSYQADVTSDPWVSDEDLSHPDQTRVLGPCRHNAGGVTIRIRHRLRAGQGSRAGGPDRSRR